MTTIRVTGSEHALAAQSWVSPVDADLNWAYRFIKLMAKPSRTTNHHGGKAKCPAEEGEMRVAMANDNAGAAPKAQADPAPEPTGDERRQQPDRRKKDIPVAVDRRKSARRSGDRRRQVDPTTCERDYTDDEIEFMKAMDDYKREFGRPFPTWSEVLEVIRSLGYRKVADPAPITGNRSRVNPPQ